MSCSEAKSMQPCGQGALLSQKLLNIAVLVATG